MKRLVPGPETTAREVVDGLRLRAEPEGDRPRVVAVMIASADGRATVEGRSVKLGHPDDRALLRELRTGVDAVLAGSATLRAERYARLLDPDQRALRAQRGQPEHPVVATVSRQVDLRADEVPLLTEPGVPVQVYAERGGSIAGATADVDVEALGAPLDIRRALRHLRRERGVRSVSCEGGPSLLRQLVEAACLDDLLLTVAPLLVAGDGPTPLSGPALVPPSELELRAVHQADGHLFLHYTL